MKVRYTRRNNVILDIRSEADRTHGETVDPAEPPLVFKSINMAKKESVRLQKKHGAGCLRADKDAPPQYHLKLAPGLTRRKVTPSPRPLEVADAVMLMTTPNTLSLKRP